MISRLTAVAVTVAVLAGASFALAASERAPSVYDAAVSAARPVRIIELPRVVVTAKRVAN